MEHIFEDAGNADNEIQRPGWKDWYYGVRIRAYREGFQQMMLSLAGESVKEYKELKTMVTLDFLQYLEQRVKAQKRVSKLENP